MGDKNSFFKSKNGIPTSKIELSCLISIDLVKIAQLSLLNSDLISFYRENVTICLVAGLSVKFWAQGLQFRQFWHDGDLMGKIPLRPNNTENDKIGSGVNSSAMNKKDIHDQSSPLK